MKIGIFGDIHSNLEGLEAVLADMEARDVTHTVCLGDIVGYNANPSECLEMVRSLGCPIVKGNHDEEAAYDRDISHFNRIAAESMLHTRKKISDEQKTFLKELPLVAQVEDFSIVHANLESPGRWGYVIGALEAENSMEHQDTQVCFFGHTHVPHVFIKDERVHEFFYKKINLKKDKSYFINVGSAGQPRDGDWRAAYVIYDMEEQTVELRRLHYDIEKAQKKIIEAGLPPRLAERLAYAM